MAVLDQIRELVRDDSWDLTTHALAGLEAGEFELEDLEEVLLNGAIRKTERDEKEEAIDGHKYAIECQTKCGVELELVCKIVRDEVGNVVLIIKAYERS